jgi:hypothetical protein
MENSAVSVFLAFAQPLAFLVAAMGCADFARHRQGIALALGRMRMGCCGPCCCC